MWQTLEHQWRDIQDKTYPLQTFLNNDDIVNKKYNNNKKGFCCFLKLLGGWMYHLLKLKVDIS